MGPSDRVVWKRLLTGGAEQAQVVAHPPDSPHQVVDAVQHHGQGVVVRGGQVGEWVPQAAERLVQRQGPA